MWRGAGTAHGDGHRYVLWRGCSLDPRQPAFTLTSCAATTLAGTQSVPGAFRTCQLARESVLSVCGGDDQVRAFMPVPPKPACAPPSQAR